MTTASSSTRIYAIGDIHGCADELRDALAKILIHAGGGRPRIIFLGDYIDRGPDSCGVLTILSQKMNAFEPVFLLGNHDLMLIEVLKGHLDANDQHVWLSVHGGCKTLESYGADLSRGGQDAALRHVVAVMPEAHRQFLADLKISHREPGLFCSHAGVDPSKSLDEQTAETLLYGDSGLFDFDHDWLSPNLRQRLGARVVHGHWSDIGGIQKWPHRLGIDTGAGYPSGRLTAVAIDGDAVEVLT